MTSTFIESQPNVDFWNDILTPKWVRFRHLLSGNGQIHSDLATPFVEVRSGQRVLDVGCGFGETCLELAGRLGNDGQVLGLDCTKVFLDIAEAEREAAHIDNVRYRLEDIESCELEEASFDVAFSRFGMMFCASPVRALRNVRRALVPGGTLHLLVWRELRANPCWGAAEEVALRYLPRPGGDAASCGPGPFSMADEATVRRMLEAAHFASAEFRRIDADVCVGITMEEAIDYQLLVGPAGFVVREAREEGQRALPEIREALRARYHEHLRADGSVWLPSSTWLISAATVY